MGKRRRMRQAALKDAMMFPASYGTRMPPNPHFAKGSPIPVRTVKPKSAINQSSISEAPLGSIELPSAPQAAKLVEEIAKLNLAESRSSLKIEPREPFAKPNLATKSAPDAKPSAKPSFDEAPPNFLREHSVRPVITKVQSGYARLAAMIALAIAIGAVAGGLLMRTFSESAAPTSSAEQKGLQENVVLLRTAMMALKEDLSVLRAGLDTSGRVVTGHISRLTDRLDRAERTQVEPQAKLSKAIEMLEKLERRGETTGTIAAATIAAAKPAIIQGLSIRRVTNGVAVIESKQGLTEVERGTVLPGIGRVENIAKQDGRWVVVTPRGLIVER